MKIFLTLLLAALFCSAALFSENAAFASTLGENARTASGRRPESGIVEGFYGRPWTEAERRMMLHFLGEHGMNLYVYAPKDDPYHREKWREPYPPQEMLALKRLAAEARTAGVELVFAVSPGLDQRFSGWAGEADEKAMLRKLESVHAMGVERFAIFFDDIEHKDGRAQALFVNRLNEELLTRRLTEKPLLVVPTEYFLQDMKTAGVAKSYTREFAAQLDDDIVVLFTGEGVVPEGISAEDMTEAERLYGRPLGIWWNYPVTDYLPGKLALGPVQGLDETVAERAPVFLMNPMEKPYLSRIALATGAKWLSSPDAYDAERAWHTAIREQYGGLAGAMELFALHSRRMEKDWAHTGALDAPLLKEQMEAFWQKVERGERADKEAEALAKEFHRLKRAAKQLKEKLPPETLAECLPQLQLFAQYAESAETSLALVKARREGRFAHETALYQKIKDVPTEQQKKEEPRLSEQVLADFIARAKSWHEMQEHGVGRREN